jgi:hypothetical protein
MFALIFLSLGGTLPFLKGDQLPRNQLWLPTKVLNMFSSLVAGLC